MKDEGRVLNQVRSPVFNGGAQTPAGQTATPPEVRQVRLVRGRDAVVAMQDLLVQLSRRTGQAGAMDWLDYLLTSPGSLDKTPYLLLVGRPSGPDHLPGNDRLTADDVEGAVLISEYRFAGRGTKVFATDDLIGIRPVIAEEGIRIEVADIALQQLMRMGAVLALVSVDGGLNGRRKPIFATGAPYRLAIRTRNVPSHLPLAGTLEETLASLGRRTRRNFRSYRRRVEADLGAQFVAQVEMGREQFLEMNRRSTNPAPETFAAWRYGLIERTSQQGESMFAGLRAADGRWLSLIGGRRRGGTTEIDWQMNLAGLPRYSLSTAMRACLIEHEIARGTTDLSFEGGTSHPMRHSMASTAMTDILAVQRRSLRAWLLLRFSRWIFPEKNFLGEALRDREMNWL